MPLVKRLVKGSPLTHAEGDGNLDYLAALVQSGTSGTSGSSGANGSSGSSGVTGTSGSSGGTGSSGSSGANGTSGSSGITGTSGSSGNGGDYNLLTTLTPAATGSVTIDISSYTVYKALEFYVSITGSSTTNLEFTISTDGGTTYPTSTWGSQNYWKFGGYSGLSGNIVPPIIQDMSTSTTIRQTSVVVLYEPFDSSKYPQLSWNSVGDTWRGSTLLQGGMATFNTAQDTDRVKIQIASGTFTGTIKVYGRK